MKPTVTMEKKESGDSLFTSHSFLRKNSNNITGVNAEKKEALRTHTVPVEHGICYILGFLHLIFA